jgi:uncharacterized protein (TIGR04255 family)
MHFSKAPITEAIIDLRVALPEGFSVEKFLDIHSHINDRFPTKEPLIAGSLVLRAAPSFKVDASQQHNGFLFRSKDNKKVFQASLNGFTFNRLAPYESWEELSDDAKYLWELYKDICKPVSVTRAALRYVNQINIPTKELDDLREYLNTVPEVAPTLPQKLLSSFFMQLQIPQQDLNCNLIINEALAPPITPEFVSIILDFDLFREQIWQSDDEDVWRFLEDLRRRKNEVFLASITEKTRRLIE